MAKFQLREVRVVGNSTTFIQNYSQKNLSPLYSNNHDVDYQYFFEFYNSYVLDLARFEDHTFAFFKGKCWMYSLLVSKCNISERLSGYLWGMN